MKEAGQSQWRNRHMHADAVLHRIVQHMQMLTRFLQPGADPAQKSTF
jgi:hypothetical protein